MKNLVRSLPMLAVLALSMGGITAVHAQDTTAVQKPISIKIGANFPTNSDARDVEGTTTLSAGLDYALTKTTENSPTLPSVYLDYAGGSKNGGHVDTYGLGLAVRQYTDTPSGANERAVSPYVGAGIGAYVVDVKNSGLNSSTKTVLGGKVLAGLEFSGSYFVEANYSLIGSNKGVNPSGFGVQVGARF